MDNLNYKASKHYDSYKIVKDKSNKFKITFGYYAVSTKSFDSIKQAEKYISQKPYELVINTFLAILDYERFSNPAKKMAENEKTTESNDK